MKPDKDSGGGNNKRNMMGIASVILWALIITVLVNYLTSVARQSSTTQIMYGEFRQMVMEDKVEKVVMTNSCLLYTSPSPRD